MLTIKRISHNDAKDHYAGNIRPAIVESFGDNNIEMVLWESLSDSQFLDQYVRDLHKDVYWWLIFHNDDLATVTMCYEPKNDNYIYVSNLCTRKQYRQKGYATLLLIELKIHLLLHNKFNIMFKGEVQSDNNSAIRLYKNVGASIIPFQNTEKSADDYDSDSSMDHIMAVRYEWSITPSEHDMMLKQYQYEKNKIIRKIMYKKKNWYNKTFNNSRLKTSIVAGWICCVLIVSKQIVL
eukprot:154792_1